MKMKKQMFKKYIPTAMVLGLILSSQVVFGTPTDDIISAGKAELKKVMDFIVWLSRVAGLFVLVAYLFLIAKKKTQELQDYQSYIFIAFAVVGAIEVYYQTL